MILTHGANSLAGSGIPSNYVQVPYIESDGTACVRNYSLSVTSSSLELHLQAANIESMFGSNTNFKFIEIIKTGTGSNGLGIRRLTSAYCSYFYGNGTAYGNSSDITDPIFNIQYTVTQKDLITNYHPSRLIGDRINSFDKVNLFPASGFKLRIYEFYGLDENNELKFNLIPCYDTTNSIYGFYEIVTRKFIVASTGAFTGGVAIHLIKDAP